MTLRDIKRIHYEQEDKAAKIPAPLPELEQWVNWKLITKRGQKKPTKVPYNPNSGAEADSTDPSTWGSYEAVSNNKEGYAGKGFVISEHDPFAFIDIDNCIVNGVIDPSAMTIVKRMDSYSELSQSKTGIHILVEGRKAGDRCKHTQLGIEIYDKERFAVMTGDHLEGTPTTINPRQDELDELYFELFPAKNGAAATDTQLPSGDIPTDDQELLDLMFASRSGDKIRRLWNGDMSAYLGKDGKPDHSSADLALCNCLAFWTGKDAARMDRMFRQSKLYRDKWKRKDYRDGTINEAIADTTEVYQGAAPKLRFSKSAAGIVELPSVTYTNGNGAHHVTGDVVTAEKPDFRTDLGNARRFTKQHGKNVRFVEEWGDLVWDGKVWKRDQTGMVMRLAKQTALSIFDEAKIPMQVAARLQDNLKAATAAGNDEAAEKATEQINQLQKEARELTAWALKSQSAARLEAMVKLAKSELPIPARPEDFDQNPWQFNFNNCTVDLRTGQQFSHRREDMITKLCPIDYDPQATCPTWLRALARWMDGKQHMVDFLQRLTGYAMTGDVSEQKLPFLQGGGSNGKTTFVKTTLEAMGKDYATQAAPDLLTTNSNGSARHPTEVADLRGMRLVASVEVEDGKKMAENLVKQLTGGDKLKARFMRQDFFAFEPTHKIMLVANHKPVITGTDHAIWRRVMLIPFTVEIGDDEKDPHLSTKLQAEYPGILAWAVRGCLAWQQGGLQVPEEVDAATREYKIESDVMARFLDECTARVAIESRADSLFKRYKKWCVDNGETEINQTRFGLELARRGYEKRVDKGTRRTFYLNLGIIDADEPEFTSSRE